jgi:hypothetical protein
MPYAIRQMPMRACHHCGQDLGPVQQVGRRDTCLGCGWDLHCCLNCRFYDPVFHNQCREPQAEPQPDKQAGNFCEYFSFLVGARTAGAPSARDSPRARLDALFAKK